MGIILQIVVDLVLVAIAAIVIPVLTLGKVRVMWDLASQPIPAAEQRWYGARSETSGRIHVTESLAVLVLVGFVVCGLLTWLALTR